MANEEWRDVAGWEGLYQVSNLGRVRRIARFRKVSDGLFEPCETNLVSIFRDRRSGYPQARLSNGKAKTCLVHRLVCEAFHGPPPFEGAHVAHWDGTRDNNRSDNLRWATPLENAEDRRRHQRDALGDAHARAKLTPEQVRDIRRRHNGRYGDGIALAREYGVTNTLITNITKRKTWKHI